MNSKVWFPLLLATLTLIGCGGSSGGGSGDCTTGTVRSSFSYSTQWTTGASGESQVISLTNASGTSFGSFVLNRASSETQFNVPNLNSGTYRVTARLFSGANGTGTELGIIDTRFLMCSATQFNSRTGGTPSNIVIYPTGSTVASNSSQAFGAHSTDAANVALFRPAGAIQWSVLGGIGTVDSNGLFQATTAGSGTVRASLPSFSLASGAPVTVSAFVPQRTKWTVLVYLNAANDLFSFSTLNVNQMEQVTSGDVRFVLQWKQSKQNFPSSTFDGTRRVLVKPDTSNNIVSDVVADLGQSVDMGDPDELNEFITWGKANYPADRYVLVVWNHGNGWLRSPGFLNRAVSYDDQTGNSIQIWELQRALQGHQVDILAWDASLMQMMEVAYEVRAHASYVAGSEESPPGEGYPYHLVFAPFRANPNASTASLSRGFVDGMLAFPQYATRKITQSVLDTSKLTAVATATSTLADRLIANVSSVSAAVQTTRNQAQSYSPASIRVYRDLDDLCRILALQPGVPANVLTAAAAVQTALDQAIVHEGHNANSANSNGLSIDFSSSSTFSSLSTDYARLEFAADTRWNEWLLIAP